VYVHVQTSPNYRAALRRACGIAVWRIAPLTMARRTHDLRRALDANGNRTRMRNRAIVLARVCVLRIRMWRTWRRIANVSGAAAGMQTMRRICGCGRCCRA
jgi:hypothetical protein